MPGCPSFSHPTTSTYVFIKFARTIWRAYRLPHIILLGARIARENVFILRNTFLKSHIEICLISISIARTRRMLLRTKSADPRRRDASPSDLVQ